VSYLFEAANQDRMSRTGSPVAENSQPFSVAAWVKILDDTRTHCFWASVDTSSDSIYYALISDYGSAACIEREGTAVSDYGPDNVIGKWHLHVAVFRSSTDREQYVDGGTSGNNTDSKTLTGTLTRYWVGARPGPNQPTNGKIATIAVYNKALSVAEIAELLRLWPEQASSYGDCVAYHDMRADQGTVTLPDAKAGNYDLSITGATYDSDNPVLQNPHRRIVRMVGAA